MKVELGPTTDAAPEAPEAATSGEPRTEADRRLRCGRCSSEITAESARVARSGSSEHG